MDAELLAARELVELELPRVLRAAELADDVPQRYIALLIHEVHNKAKAREVLELLSTEDPRLGSKEEQVKALALFEFIVSAFKPTTFAMLKLFMRRHAGALPYEELTPAGAPNAQHANLPQAVQDIATTSTNADYIKDAMAGWRSQRPSAPGQAASETSALLVDSDVADEAQVGGAKASAEASATAGSMLNAPREQSELTRIPYMMRSQPTHQPSLESPQLVPGQLDEEDPLAFALAKLLDVDGRETLAAAQAATSQRERDTSSNFMPFNQAPALGTLSPEHGAQLRDEIFLTTRNNINYKYYGHVALSTTFVRVLFSPLFAAYNVVWNTAARSAFIAGLVAGVATL